MDYSISEFQKLTILQYVANIDKKIEQGLNRPFVTDIPYNKIISNTEPRALSIGDNGFFQQAYQLSLNKELEKRPFQRKSYLDILQNLYISRNILNADTLKKFYFTKQIDQFTKYEIMFESLQNQRDQLNLNTKDFLEAHHVKGLEEKRRVYLDELESERQDIMHYRQMWIDSQNSLSRLNLILANIDYANSMNQLTIGYQNRSNFYKKRA